MEHWLYGAGIPAETVCDRGADEHRHGSEALARNFSRISIGDGRIVRK